MRLSQDRKCSTEVGSITLIFSVVTFALISIIGLVVDGRSQLTAQQRADNVAAEAARAAGQQINGSVISGSIGINRSRAVAAARDYLDAAGVRGTVSVHTNTIVIRTNATERANMLSIIGITTLTASGEATVEITTGL
jgi:Flp pilus assembly protein TadG